MQLQVYANTEKSTLIENKIQENANMITRNLQVLNDFDPTAATGLETRLRAVEGRINQFSVDLTNS